MVDVDAALVEGDVARARLEEELGAARAALAELESAQESAREKRAQWQVREAQVAARLQAATERLDRAASTRTDAEEVRPRAHRRAGAARAGPRDALDPADAVAGSARRAPGGAARAGGGRHRRRQHAARGGRGAGRGRSRGRGGAGPARVPRRGEPPPPAGADGGRRASAEPDRAGRDRVAQAASNELLETAPLLDLDLETLEAEAGRIVVVARGDRTGQPARGRGARRRDEAATSSSPASGTTWWARGSR